MNRNKFRYCIVDKRSLCEISMPASILLSNTHSFSTYLIKLINFTYSVLLTKTFMHRTIPHLKFDWDKKPYVHLMHLTSTGKFEPVAL